MIVNIPESSHLNRKLLIENDMMAMKVLRSVLKSEGMDVRRKMAMDFITPGVLVVTYADGIHSIYAQPFRFAPVSDEDMYKHNLREPKKHGAKGRYLKNE